MSISRVSKFKKRSRKTTISTSSRPKQALLLVSLLLVLFAVVRDRERSDSLFISSGRSDCDSSDDVNDSDGDDGFFYFFFFFNPLLFRF